jgi:hypothetical protein
MVIWYYYDLFRLDDKPIQFKFESKRGKRKINKYGAKK